MGGVEEFFRLAPFFFFFYLVNIVLFGGFLFSVCFGVMYVLVDELQIELFFIRNLNTLPCGLGCDYSMLACRPLTGILVGTSK